MLFPAATLAMIVIVLSTNDAQAYLDFSIGSMLMQGVLAAAAGAAVVIRNYWNRLKAIVDAIFRREARERPSDDKEHVSNQVGMDGRSKADLEV